MALVLLFPHAPAPRPWRGTMWWVLYPPKLALQSVYE
jgi:hypothetical protein